LTKLSLKCLIAQDYDIINTEPNKMALGLATYLDPAKTDGISPVSDVACQEFRHIYPSQHNMQRIPQTITIH